MFELAAISCGIGILWLIICAIGYRYGYTTTRFRSVMSAGIQISLVLLYVPLIIVVFDLAWQTM